MRNSLKTLNQIRKVFKSPGISVYTPLCHNHAFVSALLDNTFSLWFAKGLRGIGDLYVDNSSASFQQLSSKYDIPHSSFFRYVQSRHFVRENIPHFESNYICMPSLTYFLFYLAVRSSLLNL